MRLWWLFLLVEMKNKSEEDWKIAVCLRLGANHYQTNTRKISMNNIKNKMFFNLYTKEFDPPHLIHACP